jgi:hypothetical protein
MRALKNPSSMSVQIGFAGSVQALELHWPVQAGFASSAQHRR